MLGQGSSPLLLTGESPRNNAKDIAATQQYLRNKWTFSTPSSSPIWNLALRLLRFPVSRAHSCSPCVPVKNMFCKSTMLSFLSEYMNQCYCRRRSLHRVFTSKFPLPSVLAPAFCVRSLPQMPGDAWPSIHWRVKCHLEALCRCDVHGKLCYRVIRWGPTICGGPLNVHILNCFSLLLEFWVKGDGRNL